MATTLHQQAFRLFIEGKESELRVVAFSGREALNRPYAFDVELVTDHDSLDLDSQLHKLAFLEISDNGCGFHGQIYHFACTETSETLTRYRLSLRPRLAYLAHRINQRIFQHSTVPQIIAQVLEEHGILAGAYAFHFPKPYLPRDYCVQYSESDLHFIQRLCEEEGIHFHFQHSAQAHVLVFGDTDTVFRKLTPTAFHLDSGLVPDAPTVNRFGVRLATRTSRVTRRDYDFAHPRSTPEAADASDAKPDLEDYHYPGRFVDRQRGDRFAQRALQRHRSDYRLAEGRSDQPQLASGHLLPLVDHSVQEWNVLWLLTEVRHEGRQPQALHAFSRQALKGDQDGFLQGYRNRFYATMRDVPFRPALKHPKPRMAGAQTARVTGPEGEEIHCDPHGRVKVQFFWDRDGRQNEHSSCWLRVASTWAGERMGAWSLPRVGMEVLVTFLEGDPDQPLITGCLYNGLNLPPYKLPDLKTLSTLKSKEYRGSRGNELRIDDTCEQISIALRSDHGASAINLGYLTQPRPYGGKPRGEGFELRTDQHGAIRAAAGLLITTEPRFNEAGHHKDLPEAAERLATACGQQEGFAMQARHCLAQETGDQDEVADALARQQQGIAGTDPAGSSGGRFPEFSERHLVMSSPAGAALTTARSTHIATGEHLALSSTGHTSLSIGKRLLASASRGMRLFVQSMGWRLVAASGDIDIRALKDSINLLARLNVTVSAERITLSAKTELVIQGGGSATTWNAGGITHATTGPYTVHGANFVWTGAKSSAAPFPQSPKPGQGHLELYNRYANLSGVNGSTYEVLDALGARHTGVLDPTGFATVSGAAPGPAQVKFGADPADSWAPGSHVATARWPAEPPRTTALPAVMRPLVDKALQNASIAQSLAGLTLPSSLGALKNLDLPPGENDR